MYYIIAGLGRLFESKEEAEFWNEKYGINGIIEEYSFKKEVKDESMASSS